MCSSMDGPAVVIIILSEVKQTERDKHHMISLAYAIQKKMIQRNLFTKQKQTHRYRKQTGLPKGKARQRDKLGIWD